MKIRRIALEGAITLATIAMRLSPIERDLLAAGIFLALCRFRPAAEVDNDVHAES